MNLGPVRLRWQILLFILRMLEELRNSLRPEEALKRHPSGHLEVQMQVLPQMLLTKNKLHRARVQAYGGEASQVQTLQQDF